MGVKSVTLFDPHPVAFADLAANFYLGEADVGRPRAAAAVAKLAALNTYVIVSVFSGAAITPEAAARYGVIVAADLPISDALRLGALARGAGARFVLAEARGVFARVFCDFGREHVVDDATGENPRTAMVASITSDAPGVVTCTDDARHGLEDGDVVVFSEVQGMVEVNSAAAPGGVGRPIKVIGPYTFSIEDTRGYGAYVRGGWVTQVKQPRTVSFKPLSDLIGPMGANDGPAYDDIVASDYGKADSVGTVHAGFGALHAFAAGHGGRFPTPGVTAEEDAVVAAATAAAVASSTAVAAAAAAAGAAPPPPADVALLRQMARCAGGSVSPVASALGGIAAQEVLKAVSGKFMPVRQWLYFDGREVLHPGDAPLPGAAEGDFAPAHCRYDGQIAVFGRAFQTQLGRLKYFLVGAGAIGCEVLKCWAVMGVGAAGGCVTITDMDRIEKSNLSRQFLFRASDIGKAKSTCAMEAARAMNPSFAGIAYETRVGPDTESVFNDEFWEGLDGVCTALDNVDARLYVDSRVVYYGRPLLESGTLGTKGNTQVVVPRLTENYGASRDPPEASIPICTLKNFPNKIEHTLGWARDWFEGEFKQVPDAANAYLAEPDFLSTLAKAQNTRIDTLEKLLGALVTEKPTCIEDCVRWARLRFAELFSHSLKQLLFNFPADTLTSNGEPFWSGPKRAPTPIEFCADDPTHAAFIAAATQLRAHAYGLKLLSGGQHAVPELARMAAAVVVPPFSPREGVQIAANEKELEEQQRAAKEAAAAAAASSSSSSSAAAGAGAAGAAWDVDARAAAHSDRLPPPRTLAGFRISPIEFEKDDDTHITLITAASNLRARAYRIEEADKHASKLIAGKIIPAIATTTALVSGLVCLELYKLAIGKPLSAFKNVFANLALPLLAMSEPVRVAKRTLRLRPDAAFVPPPVPAGDEVVVEAAAAAGAAAGAAAAAPRTWTWSVWDRLDVEGPLTLRELIEWFRVTLGVSVQMVSFGTSILYAFYTKPALRNERLKRGLANLAETVSKQALPRYARFLTLEVVCIDPDSGEEVELPCVRYRLGPAEIAVAVAEGVAAGQVLPPPAAAATVQGDVDMKK